MSLQYDVLVVGGGVVGLTAALAMAKRNYTVAIIDAGSFQVDLSNTDRRVYAINRASELLLEQLHVWPHLDKNRLSPYQHMHVWDALSGAYIDFDSRQIAAQRLGTIAEESILKSALLQELNTQPQVKLFPDQTIEDIHCDTNGARLRSTDQEWQGLFVMIADGAQSPTRQKLKVGITSWSYHQQAIVATVQTEKPHQHTAYQVFHPDGPLAFLPLANPHHCSIVWSTSKERAKELMVQDDEDFNSQLNKAFAQRLGHTQVITKRHQFPLQMRHVKQYSGSHWLLLGDAAHTIHPLAGLGLNVGLADVSSFLKLVDNNPNKQVSPKLLRSYQRERKTAVWQTILLMEGFKQLFGVRLSPITTLRGLGLRACNELTPIKRLFIQHAAGI